MSSSLNSTTTSLLEHFDAIVISYASSSNFNKDDRTTSQESQASKKTKSFRAYDPYGKKR